MKERDYLNIGYHFSEYLRLGNRYEDLDRLKTYLTKKQIKVLEQITKTRELD